MSNLLTSIGKSVIININDEAYVPQSRVEALLLESTRAMEKLIDALDNIASIETGDEASQHYNKGEYIIWNGNLYQTIQEIQEGDIFVENTNITQVILGDEIEIINAALDDIRGILGSVEKTNIASRNYSVGDYIVYNNKLYIANRAITSGQTLTQGSNITETNLKEVVESIINKIPVVTTNKNGLMLAADKLKLDNIAPGANNYVHPSYYSNEYTAHTGVPTTNQSPSFGGSFNVTQPTSDNLGHITGMTSRQVTIPNAVANASSPGLMSAAMFNKLEGIASGAQVNAITGVKGNAESSYRTGNVNLTPANIGAATTDLVTTSANGLMSASDKAKIDGIAAGAQPNPGLASTSANGLMSYIDKAKLDSIDALGLSNFINVSDAITGTNGITVNNAYYRNGFLIINCTVDGISWNASQSSSGYIELDSTKISFPDRNWSKQGIFIHEKATGYTYQYIRFVKFTTQYSASGNHNWWILATCSTTYNVGDMGMGLNNTYALIIPASYTG